MLHQGREGQLSVCEAARRAKLVLHHFCRLLRRFEREDDSAVVHRARGRRPNNAKPHELRDRVLERARGELFPDFGPTLLSEHLAQDPKIGVVNPHTLRRWLIEAGLAPSAGRRFKTTIPDESAARPLDLVERDFTAMRPDPLRV